MDVQGALNLVLILGVILGGIGYAGGQFLTQRRKGANEALKVALDEISALQVRSDRLSDDLAGITAKLAKVEAENRTMREILSGGTFLADQLKLLVAAEVDRGVALILGTRGGS